MTGDRTSEYSAELIFPPDHLHNHASCLVEVDDGSMLAVWYSGTGERDADDVRIMGAWLYGGTWSRPFELANTPGFPDCNPCTFVDPRGHLWLFWPTILDNRWESALLKYKVSADYQDRTGPPRWHTEKVLHVKPGDEFGRAVDQHLERHWLAEAKHCTAEEADAIAAHLAKLRALLAQKLQCRLGWMPRAHPVMAGDRRMILPLYSDAFDFSIMAITDDWGEHWHCSAPLVGAGCIQPALARRRDGTFVAYMRDNGPMPKRIMVSESLDGGETWSDVQDTNLPNPGSGVDLAVLANGMWALVYNDCEDGRYTLAVSLSDDEGKTWRWTRHLERDDPQAEAGSYSYPSIIQARDGFLHVTYSYALPPGRAQTDALGRPMRETIKHVRFSADWVISGDQAG
ncbi:MAG: sialidase family protein [Armatimonadota bacterium]